MARQLTLLGNEAVGLGALHAGLSGVFGYPGTPSTEIFEFIQSQAEKFGVRAIWSANEKVGYEEALGMSYAGKRVLITMKHVGLNVAADPFMNSSMTGVGGGLVVCSADDPSMHSSQNEQDSRYYADFARIPCFEPSNQQEAYDMMSAMFELSEKMDVPIMLRMVTRLSHSRANITPGEKKQPQNDLKVGDNVKKWVLLPPHARVRNIELINKQPDFIRAADESRFNHLDIRKGARLGIIATGIAYNYVREAVSLLDEPVNILKITQYPMPAGLIRKLVDSVDRILVVEEGYPLVEMTIQGMFGIPGKTVIGRLTGDLPRTGEMNVDHVKKAIGLTVHETVIDAPKVPGRPPALCKGCPHADTFRALKEAMSSYPSARVFTDIGCYTLGVYDPYNVGDTCVDMGASLSMSIGASAAGVHPAIAVIGDSTFIHSGMTPLIGAAKNNAAITVIIMDNSLVAMTGAQETMATGGNIEKIVESFGVPREHIVTLNPLPKHHAANVALIRKELEHTGVSVVIPQRVCVKAPKKG
ncbi:indolepyruvate ferredoxin oxidoreductase [bacterium]|nr:indolepyruvate ferredoxin oxidoreductase [candidate division CSSED10-310 bacterium]